MSPSLPGLSSAKAPNGAIFTTLASNSSPTSTSRVRSSIHLRAPAPPSSSVAATKMVPSSSMSMLTSNCSSMLRIIFPPGPMTRPIFSLLMEMEKILGAYFESSVRG